MRNNQNMAFKLLHKDEKSRARAGILSTDHGDIETPIFMPVGTSATVKGVHQKELQDEVKAQIILGNTYHLYLRPGSDLIQRANGLHNFMHWHQPILTDSGGYQVFSLSDRRKITEEGVIFYSHIDGSKHLFTPESVVDIQRSLGSDIMMVLDECPAYPCEKKYAKKSMDITHRWLDRGMQYFQKSTQLYNHRQIYVPIAQGSMFEDLRKTSLEYISQYKNPIYAIGGLSVGEPVEELHRYVTLSDEILPENSARYLMGVGTPENILNCIEKGIDMFDCVLPSRNARHGLIYTTNGIIHIKNEKWKEDFSPLDNGLHTTTSNSHSKAYLRHLFLVKELLAAQIATLQNLSFYLWLVKEARRQIIADNYGVWKNNILGKINRKL